ncbi:MAG: YjjG family noncanonical pyrimidine nucleotidase [Clostridia bacterium]|nr:YjjG family noncanonical pyrimidine nucleotidase [Clostridia bacterium]
MKYKYLLWDIDGTVMNFQAAERAAIRALFAKYGFGPCTDDMLEAYSRINIRYWQALERNEMTKPEILVARFRDFFTACGLPADRAEAFNEDYQPALGDTVVFNDNAPALLMALHERGYILCAVTNGTQVAQHKKLAVSGLDRIFNYIFISEEIGTEKPNIAFFDSVLDTVGDPDRSRYLIIGDSLTSDILGGNNAGIDTCWYAPADAVPDRDVRIVYRIHDLKEIMKVLGA